MNDEGNYLEFSGRDRNVPGGKVKSVCYSGGNGTIGRSYAPQKYRELGEQKEFILTITETLEALNDSEGEQE